VRLEFCPFIFRKGSENVEFVVVLYSLAVHSSIYY